MCGASNPSYLDSKPPRGSDPQRPTAELLLWGYAHGLFPMVDSGRRRAERVEWFCPDPRGLFPLDPPEAFHVPRNVKREVRSGRFAIQSDRTFESVIRACAAPRSSQNPSWLNEQLIQSYVGLHALGHAHSVEAWRDGKLVGGLYGVHIGGAFFGESMFSRPELGGSNSSKVCLVHLVHWLRRRGFALLDTQFWNEHLDQFGCIEVSNERYLETLDRAIRMPLTWGEFEASSTGQ
ncbi:MAG: leucyl/phenylalanyl-tRNA--protein transferase [Phycisphaerales bacterium]|nr:leucyl/phenylalanyl-tRNA--protein transferase [Phycisphaerales bacterium]MCI0630677.1 leucyl/phenylalanyl-tRNA--protein transferase [Phycisphaerales bacterium]MCI0674527.1 leucyl/phenylalanyl-tRNA--protein transferase [Phycisphaerales bacterium]